MTEEFDRLSEVCRMAKINYAAAERSLSSARFALNYAERQLKAEWDKMESGRPVESETERGK